MQMSNTINDNNTNVIEALKSIRQAIVALDEKLTTRLDFIAAKLCAGQSINAPLNVFSFV